MSLTWNAANVDLRQITGTAVWNSPCENRTIKRGGTLHGSIQNTDAAANTNATATTNGSGAQQPCATAAGAPDREPPKDETAQEVEVLQASIKLGTVAQIVVAVIAVVGLIYLLKLVLITTLASLLLAYLLEPLVRGLSVLRVPRWAGALTAVVLAIAVTLGAAYFSLNSAVEFADQLPTYSSKIREVLGKIRAKAGEIESSTRSAVEPPTHGKQPVTVKVQQPAGFTKLISENGGTIMDILMAVGFVPFLVYFMLMSKDHCHVATVRLFPKEHRMLAHRTVANISAMIRSYIVANVFLGLLNSGIFVVIFWVFGIHYFYFIGPISGFATLIPYLGVFLAPIPPLAGGIDILSKTGVITILVAIIGLHIITINFIYPKIVGRRLRLNPLVVSLSLLFWAWICGAAGLILAIPILGAAKIICDHVDTLRGLGSWLGEAAVI